MMRKWKIPGREPDDENAEEAEREPFAWLGLAPGNSEKDEEEDENEEVVKLIVPSRDEVETRSFQPGLEELIETEPRTLTGLEADWGNAATERRPLPWGWFVLIGLLLAGGAVWSLVQVRFAGSHLDSIRLETGALLDSEEASIQEAEDLMRRMEATLHAYVTAPDVEARIQVVRHPDRVRRLMEDHYSRHEFDTYGKPRIEAFHPLTLASYGHFWMVKLMREDGGRVNLIVEADEDGPALVDWETAVCYQPMDWDDYARARPAGSSMDFRVYLEPDSLYSHEFQDASVWNCYKLTAIGGKEMLFGYVLANSPWAELLREWFRRHPDSHNVSMILRLSVPDGLESPRGVVIDEVLSVRWIYIDSPDGES